MKITILNGSSEPSAFEGTLGQIKTVLEAQNHSVTLIDLRHLSLHYCIGCWGCWVKIPGQCVAQDDSVEIDRAVINSDFTLWAAPLKMGFPDALLKMALDKHLPLIHPYMESVHNEAHHLKRYDRYPRVGLLVGREEQTDEADLSIVADIFSRTALNLKSSLEFSLTTATPAEEVARRITAANPTCLPLPKHLPATSGMNIVPPKRLTLFNGSPRGRKGNTPIFLREIAAGFGGPSETHHLIRVHETEPMVQAFADAECVILGMPLYTDAMPGIVKHFIEALEPLVNRTNNPPIGFVVQSGFPEGLHSRYLERYLEKLARRLGSPYLGTVVKGNGEAVRVMPDNMNKSLFANLQAAGAALATQGCFDAAALAKIVRPERFPAVLSPVLQLFVRLPVAHSYFDSMLKENGVYERRYDQPFVKGT